VEEAKRLGATVLAGGTARPDLGPYFYEPTILADVTPEMRLCADETFGPVVSVYPFRDDDEAVRLANDTEFGLNASVWTDETAPRALVPSAQMIRRALGPSAASSTILASFSRSPFRNARAAATRKLLCARKGNLSIR
jgi:hypothetical protein